VSNRFSVLFLGLCALLLPTIAFNQDCAITSELTIVADGSSNVILNVEGLVNDDLANNQTLCGVRLVFKHDLVENIRMTLVSPSGQRVTLVGPGRINSDPSFAIAWNVAFVPCSVPPSPDSGISGVWDNGEPWSTFTTYTGVYHPFDNCLEDFNIGSANGSWTLEIENLGDVEGILEFFQLIFCDPAGSMCSECFLFAGNFNFTTPGGIYSFCETDPLSDLLDFKLDQDSILSSSQAYTFIYSQNDSIVKFSDSPNEISDLIPGVYKLCGLAFQSSIEDTIMEHQLLSRLDSLIDNRSVCADLTEDCITLRILEIENKITIDTIFCDGDSISFFGEIFYDDIDTTVIISNFLQDRCDSLITLSARKKTVNSVINNNTNVSQCGSSVFLNGNNSSANLGQVNNYFWSTNDGTFEINIGPIAEVSSGGTYYLTAQSDQCFATDSIVIQQIDTFEWSFNVDPPLCYLDSFVLIVNSDPNNVEFIFNGPETVESIDNQTFYTFSEGTYELEAILGTCKDSLVFNLNQEATELTLDVSSTVITCLTDSSEIVINTNAINANFELSGPQSLVTTLDTIFSTLEGEYTLNVVDELGCEILQTFTILEEREDPIFDVQDLSHFCDEAVPNLSALISSPFDSILWTGPNSFFSDELLDIPIDEGTYTLTVFGSNGCTLSKSIIYTINNVPFPIDIIYTDIDCENQSSEVCYINTSNHQLNWLFENETISENACFMATEPGNYILEAIDDNGCVGTDSVFINDLRIPIEINLIIDPQTYVLSCSQPSIVIEAEIIGSQANLIYEWFDGTSLISNANNINVDEPTEIILVVKDTISNCFYEEMILIMNSFNPFENFQIDIIQPVCEGDLGSITEISPLSWDTFDIFLNGNLILNNSELQMLSPGDYTLEVVDENSCLADTIFKIEKGRELRLDLGEDVQTAYGSTISIEGQLNIDESDVSVYEWSNMDSLSCTSCLTPSLSVYSNEIVTLEITDSFGCKVSDKMQVIIDNEVKYFVPNVFSPNNDGDNDYLSIYLSDGILKVFDFRVMDRWGNLVLFRPEVLNENDILIWDGFSNGKFVEQGVYVYVAKLLLIDGTETLISGNITVIR
jgi:gliding motility-associated-like protein